MDASDGLAGCWVDVDARAECRRGSPVGGSVWRVDVSVLGGDLPSFHYLHLETPLSWRRQPHLAPIPYLNVVAPIPALWNEWHDCQKLGLSGGMQHAGWDAVDLTGIEHFY